DDLQNFHAGARLQGPRKIVGLCQTIRMGQREKSELEAIRKSSNEALISTTLASVVTSWNPAAERIFGYRADEMLGQSILKIVTADRRERETEICSRAALGESTDNYETQRLSKTGREVDVSVSYIPLRDELARITGVLTITADLSERRRLTLA